ncbi:MAG: Cof-type HAD-IIB family hydrolase [Xanthobacteraceae bacterium]
MRKISLVISDVDGTLVTSDKRLTDASVRAVRRLAERKIGFTITSSRPPIGLRMLVGPLALALPMGAFNGAAIVDPDLSVVEEHVISQAAAQQAVHVLSSLGVDIWMFATGRWLLRDPSAPYTDRERRAIQAEPEVVTDFRPFLDKAGKIVGVSADFPLLARCEEALRSVLGDSALAVRSQPYYLDVTPRGFDKGTLVLALSQRLRVPIDEIVTLGDMENDLTMFRCSGFSIAMGNASEEVKRQAHAVTLSNDTDGFAAAIDRYILAPLDGAKA